MEVRAMRKQLPVLLVVVLVLAVALSAGARMNVEEMTTRRAIEQAFQERGGNISELILAKAQALYESGELDADLRGGLIDKSGTPMALEIYRALPELPADVSDRVTRMRARPSCDASITTEHFRIHYDTSGTHKILNWPNTSYRDAVATAAEYVYDQEVTAMGFVPPADDSGDPDGGGGCERYDIYVQNLSGVYGYCQPTYYTGSGNAATSYVVIDNDYAGFGYPDPTDPMKVTVAHEFNHSCQMAVDITEELWYMECTAVWAEEQVYDSIDDYTQYIPYYFNSTYRSLDWEDGTGLRIYGTCVWNIFLSENVDPGVVSDYWNACGGNSSVYQYLDMVLANYGTTIEEQFHEFAMWNWFTGSRCDGAHYSEGASWPLVSITRTFGMFPIVDGEPYSTYRPDHMGMNFIRFTNPGTGWTGLHLAYDGPATLSTPNGASVLQKTSGGTTSEYGDISLNPWGNGDITVEGWDGLSEVVMVVSNQTDNANDMTYTFDAEQVETSVEEGGEYAFALRPASPNPFAASTSIAYTVPTGGGRVEVTIHDVSGRAVRTLVNGHRPAGPGEVRWDGLDSTGRPVATGVYFARLNIDGTTASGKLMVLK
ncbi:MAG: T9SS type A sorting domain-containing protein [Candidatus Eisenbacteria bacterium]|nr:T9SS type A sorting domain-containing protein [Candidatus Eisenbacteria bacterium]